MVQRRTRALVELVGSGLTLLVSIRLREYIETQDEPIPVSLSGVTVGMLSQGSRLWLWDNDVAGVRTNRGRRLLHQLAWSGWQLVVRRSVLDSRVAGYDFHLGRLIGTMVYRLWYGLLRPLPGSDD